MRKAVWIIAKKEFRDNFRERRLLWAIGLILILLFTSFIISLNYSRTQNNIRKEAQIAQREQWVNKSAVNSHVAAHAGTTLFRPNLLLTAIDNGVDSYLGTSVFLEPHRRNLFQQTPIESTIVLQQLGELMPAFTLQVIVPLIIFLLTFSVFTAEKEQGTLRIVFIQGCRTSDLAIGKLIGTSLPLFSILILVIAIGIMVLTTVNPQNAEGFSSLRLYCMSMGYLVYYSVFISIGLAVSALSKTSQKSFTILLGFWFFTCLIIPRMVMTIAQQLYPTPTSAQFVQELELTESKIPPFMEQRAGIERELMDKYHVSKPIDLPVSSWGVTLFKREEESTRLYNQQFDKLFNQYERQNNFYQLFALIAPPIAIQMLSMTLAGSDVSHFRHFAGAVDDYRYQLVQQMNQIAVESKLYNASLFAPPDRAAFPDGEKEAYLKVKPFNYAMPTFKWALGKARFASIGLLLWLALTIIFLPRILFRIKVL